MHGLRRAGPDISDTRSEHRPLGDSQQHTELHERVFAIDLVGPNSLIPSVFQPPHGLTLQIDMRRAGE
jgi:hypothetical protein